MKVIQLKFLYKNYRKTPKERRVSSEFLTIKAISTEVRIEKTKITKAILPDTRHLQSEGNNINNKLINHKINILLDIKEAVHSHLYRRVRRRCHH
jgi:hypothetical protein